MIDCIKHSSLARHELKCVCKKLNSAGLGGRAEIFFNRCNVGTRLGVVNLHQTDGYIQRSANQLILIAG